MNVSHPCDWGQFSSSAVASAILAWLILFWPLRRFCYVRVDNITYLHSVTCIPTERSKIENTFHVHNIICFFLNILLSLSRDTKTSPASMYSSSSSFRTPIFSISALRFFTTHVTNSTPFLFFFFDEHLTFSSAILLQVGVLPHADIC